MSEIKIIDGWFNIRGVPTNMSGRVFELVKSWKQGSRGGYITVNAEPHDDLPDRNIRISCESNDDWEYASEEDKQMAEKNNSTSVSKDTRSDQEIMEQHREKFQMLKELTGAAKKGNIRSMIVSGPPGVGKSFGVEYQLGKNDLITAVDDNKLKKYKFVKGAISPIGLYQELYYYRHSDCVVVFDDCDGIFTDELSLNLLKAALDSKKQREIAWSLDSRQLKEAGIPNSFLFEGSAIFITNLKFEHIRSKKLQEHVAALESRSHYFDLGVDTSREKILRIKQLVDDGMLEENGIYNEDIKHEIYEYIYENQDRLREISLRTAIKCADLAKAFPDKWQRIAETTVMKK